MLFGSKWLTYCTGEYKGLVTYTVTVPEEIDYDFRFAGMEQVGYEKTGNTHTFLLK